ncbi:hypothetical protein A9Z42_0037150 [Trichoderma parareesei]|uniref:Uncharacterized protein n=1 Tax=Trichoderma parareesei TaxID=858221 RepID=A0A2H2ZMD2_TRIPA|nr:hypothetical protein A9Z42_0037150 [Trichoderma parareesei]
MEFLTNIVFCNHRLWLIDITVDLDDVDVRPSMLNKTFVYKSFNYLCVEDKNQIFPSYPWTPVGQTALDYKAALVMLIPWQYKGQLDKVGMLIMDFDASDAPIKMEE